MVESGLKGGFCDRALVNAKGAINITYHDRIETTPYYFIHRDPKNFSKVLAFFHLRLYALQIYHEISVDITDIRDMI